MPPIKNQVIQTDSEGNIIKIINSEDGDINVE